MAESRGGSSRRVDEKPPLGGTAAASGRGRRRAQAQVRGGMTGGLTSGPAGLTAIGKHVRAEALRAAFTPATPLELL